VPDIDGIILSADVKNLVSDTFCKCKEVLLPIR